jgi:hypothetical protein
MSIIIVTYDLNSPTRDYTPLFSAIQSQGVWWHNLRSTWLIDTQKTPGQVYEALRHHLEQTDRILITRMGEGYSGWLSKDAWEWIQLRVKQI